MCDSEKRRDSFDDASANVRQRPNADLIYLGIIASVTACGAGWLLLKGPMPVVRGAAPLGITVPFWYMVSAFPFLGMLVAELLSLVVRGSRREAVRLGVVLLFLVAIGQLRISLGLPVSGHAVLLSYFVLRRSRLQGHSRIIRHIELWTAVGVSIVIAYVKLMWWRDPVTLSVGALAGLLTFAAERRFPGKKR